MIVQVSHYGPFMHNLTAGFVRANLELYGLSHLRPSYEGLVYFNDTEINPDDEQSYDPGRPSFAGNFALFGHAQCWGGDGHCHDVVSGRRFDTRPSHPMTKAFRRVIVTRALSIAVEQSDKLRISIITRTQEDWEPDEDQRLLSCQGLQLATFA